MASLRHGPWVPLPLPGSTQRQAASCRVRPRSLKRRTTRQRAEGVAVRSRLESSIKRGDHPKEDHMDRRDFLKAGAVVVAASAGAQALAQAEDQATHEHHHEKASTTTGPAGWESNAAVIDAASNCVKAGEICLEHCPRLLRTGDVSMTGCSTSVRTMLVLCRASGELAIQDAPYLKHVAATCAKACRQCETACREHAAHHEPCRRCMEACQRCAVACERIAA